MAQTIKIKRSTGNGKPSSVAQGELFYSYGTGGTYGKKLAIGNSSGGTDTPEIIGGSYYTGIVDGATNANTASKLVLRDGSGNFSAGTITATLSGNASTATLLQNARSIGGVSFNGSASIDLPGVNEAGTQTTTGNAATATILATARAINGVAFNGSAPISIDTDATSEGSSNLYYTDARTSTRADTILNHSNHSNITVSKVGTELRFSAASQYGNSDARTAISVTDSGGDGALSYNNSTGVITYTGPNAAQTRAHLSAGTGVAFSGGAFSIGQAVATTSNVTFNNLQVDGTLTSDDITSTNISVAGNATITGNLTVQGTTTTVDSTTVAIGDNIITLNNQLADATAPSLNAGFTVYRGTGTNSKPSASFLWDETNHYWTAQEGDTANVTSKVLTASNFAASFTGIIDGGTFS